MTASCLKIFLALTLAGCSLFTAEPTADQLAIRTDQAVYTARDVRTGARPRYTFDIVARFHNLTPKKVYLARCFPDSPKPIYWLELVAPENEWGSAFGGNWACVGHENPIKVGRGELRMDTLRFTGPSTIPRFGLLEGRFRLRYQALSCRTESDCDLPDSVGVSNEFEVRLEG